MKGRKVLKLIRLNEFYIDSLSNEMIWKMRHLSAVTAHGKKDKKEKFIFIFMLDHVSYDTCTYLGVSNFYSILCSNNINTYLSSGFDN